MRVRGQTGGRDAATVGEFLHCQSQRALARDNVAFRN